MMPLWHYLAASLRLSDASNCAFMLASFAAK
jgi:hypothetical protein